MLTLAALGGATDEAKMTDPDIVARTYLQTWNETDKLRRNTWLEDKWTRDAVYVDPMASACGGEEISRLIGGVQERFADFSFALLGQPSGYGSFIRFSWSLGPKGAEPPIKGSDVVELRDGKISRVIGFLDQVPAG
jgi:SnoaL-like domain